MLLILVITRALFMFINPLPLKFEEQVIDNNISIGYGIAVGDVDGDGKPDILLADKKEFVWYRNGDWKKFVMIENLTRFDNVCITAKDITGDGKVEVAVGAQWNPSETNDATLSGSVHYLIRPDDATQRWKAVELHHEPTVHRMQWIKSEGKYFLVVLPLHGQGNTGGAGKGVKILAYEYPEDVNGQWKHYTIDENMHLTHNLEIVESSGNKKTELYISGKEGIRVIRNDLRESAAGAEALPGLVNGAGEVRTGKVAPAEEMIATIEPMHGDKVVVYLKNQDSKRVVIDDDVKEGHALAVADLSGLNSDQVVAGWRLPNKEGKVGIKLYTSKNRQGTQWESRWIDENGMACEDLKVMDLNGDGKKDIIASGRATHNLKVYWNR